MLGKRKIVKLTDDEENVIETKMVWVFGSPRSGSTWFANRLLRHDRNTNWSEPYIGLHLDLFRKWKLTRENYFFSDKYKEYWLPYLRKLILLRAFGIDRDIQKNVIIKEPNGSQGADIICECLPNSKVIFLLRDGRDIVDSLIDTHKENSWNENKKPIKSNEERKELIKKYSQDWKATTEIVLNAFNNHDDNLKILVKYENLIKDTLEELKKVYQFLDLEINEEQMSKIITKFDFKNIPAEKKGSGKFNRSASPGKWRESFDNEEKKIMEEIMLKTLLKLGYS